MNVERYAVDPSRFLLENRFVPVDLEPAYSSVVADLLTAIRLCFHRAGQFRHIRLHGDCHAGNVLWTEVGPHFVDFDDCMMGPAMQDLWMLLSGSREEMAMQLSTVMEGYQDFAEFNFAELHLTEALRTLRMIHYAGWLARRWHDPAFPMNFPWFNTQRYWQDHILSLREQLSAMEEPPLSI
jgi:Ser/Thr protein kinase RdoA (MazF antagonist)